MFRKFAFVLALAVPFGLAACEEDPLEPEFAVVPGDFGVFDLNDDALLTEPEFDAGFTSARVFTTFDVDGDGFVETAEFAVLHDDFGTFDDFDVDLDDRITEAEFLDRTFVTFDATRDAFIDVREFEAGLDLF